MPGRPRSSAARRANTTPSSTAAAASSTAAPAATPPPTTMPWSAAANAVASDPDNIAKYQALCDLLDVDNFITYLLANWFTGNHDWPQKNWYATHRNTPDGKWRFHSWDAEHVTEGTNSVGQSPSDIHRKLASNPNTGMKFADIIHRNFFHDGPLTYPAAADLYKARMDQIDRAIVGESARWGDNRDSMPYTRQDWLNVQNAKLANFFPGQKQPGLQRPQERRPVSGRRRAGIPHRRRRSARRTRRRPRIVVYDRRFGRHLVHAGRDGSACARISPEAGGCRHAGGRGCAEAGARADGTDRRRLENRSVIRRGSMAGGRRRRRFRAKPGLRGLL